jgi:AsmA protein
MIDDPPPAREPGRTGGAAMQRGRRKPRRLWLGFAGYGALAIMCVTLAAATFLVIAAPLDVLRDRLAQQIKARTGRTLQVSGQTRLFFFPSLGLRLGEVFLSAPADMGGPPTLVMHSLEVQVELLSLLSSQIIVKRLVLNGPLIDLRIDAQGRRSWDLAQQSSPRRSAQLAPRAADTASAAVFAGLGARAPDRPTEAPLARVLGQLVEAANVRTIDGTVRYSDERVGAGEEITGLNVDLAVIDPARPLMIKGSLAWRGEKVAFEATLGPVGVLLESGQAQLEGRALARAFEAAFAGKVHLGDDLALEGNLTLKAASALALGQWLGAPVSSGSDAGALALASTVSAAGGQLALSGFNASVGDRVLSGDVTLATAPLRPHVSGQIRMTELDVGSVLMGSRSRDGAPAQAVPSATTPADAIEGLLRRKGGQGVVPQEVRGFTKRAAGAAGWSDDVIEWSNFGLVDVDLALSVERLVYKDIKTGQGRLALALRDRVARVALENVQLYEGRARGELTLDGSGQVPATAANLTLDGVATSTLLHDALGLDWLEGHARMTLGLTGRGISERQMMETLNGRVDMAMADGAIAGMDIAKLLRGIEQARLAGFARSPSERTAFAELAATFLIADGVAENRDLRLLSPSLTVTGGGRVELAQRRLDYTVRTKIAANGPREGSIINLAGLEIPVRIEGPWEKPTFTPNLTGVLKDQDGAMQALKQIGKNLQSQDVQDALRGMLGGGDGTQRVKPRELLEKLLKKE